MTSAEHHRKWRQEFESQPRIWFTIDSDGVPMNFYESEEAALVEVRWVKARRNFGMVSVSSSPIHSLKLSEDRWRTT